MLKSSRIQSSELSYEISNEDCKDTTSNSDQLGDHQQALFEKVIGWLTK